MILLLWNNNNSKVRAVFTPGEFEKLQSVLTGLGEMFSFCCVISYFLKMSILQGCFESQACVIKNITADYGCANGNHIVQCDSFGFIFALYVFV